MQFCNKISKSCFSVSLQVRKSGQVLMRSILQAKKDSSSLNTFVSWFQGFISLRLWCHIVSFKQMASYRPKRLSLRDLSGVRDQRSGFRFKPQGLGLGFQDPGFFIRSVIPNSCLLFPIFPPSEFCPLPSVLCPPSSGPCLLSTGPTLESICPTGRKRPGGNPRILRNHAR
jgi:hypothetical protein